MKICIFNPQLTLIQIEKSLQEIKNWLNKKDYVFTHNSGL